MESTTRERAPMPSQRGRRPLSFLPGGKFAPEWSGGHRPDGLMQVAGRRADPGEARSTAGALLRIVIRTPSAVNCCRKNRVQKCLAYLTPVASPSQTRAAFVPMTVTNPLTGQSGMNGHALRNYMLLVFGCECKSRGRHTAQAAQAVS